MKEREGGGEKEEGRGNGERRLGDKRTVWKGDALAGYSLHYAIAS